MRCTSESASSKGWLSEPLLGMQSTLSNLANLYSCSSTFGLFYVHSSHTQPHSAVWLQHLQAIHPILLSMCSLMSSVQYMQGKLLPAQHSVRSACPKYALCNTSISIGVNIHNVLCARKVSYECTCRSVDIAVRLLLHVDSICSISFLHSPSISLILVCVCVCGGEGGLLGVGVPPVLDFCNKWPWWCATNIYNIAKVLWHYMHCTL